MKIENSLIRVIVGLGNPGDEYMETRHSLGREIVEELARRLELDWQAGPGGKLRFAKGEWARLVVPETFMNLSGGAVRGFLHFFKIPTDALLVVHDDLDLPFGDIRMSLAGSSGGHHGIESIDQELATNQYWRLRVGIGRPEGSRDPDAISQYVLGSFTPAEREQLPGIVDGAIRLLLALDKVPPEADTLHLIERS